MNLLSFCGARRSGKTISANIIVESAAEMGIYFRKVSFADTLRQEFSKQTGIAIELLTSNLHKEEFRPRLIEWGDKARKENPFVFVNKLFESIDPQENIVIDDVRYLEEFTSIITNKGLLYKIETLDTIRVSRGWKYDSYVDEHPSETELGTMSGDTLRILGGKDVIYNNKSIMSLQKELVPILKKYFVRVRL